MFIGIIPIDQPDNHWTIGVRIRYDDTKHRCSELIPSQHQFVIFIVTSSAWVFSLDRNCPEIGLIKNDRSDNEIARGAPKESENVQVVIETRNCQA
jgi:hypothetical protein